MCPRVGTLRRLLKTGVCPVVSDNDADLYEQREEKQDTGYVSLESFPFGK